MTPENFLRQATKELGSEGVRELFRLLVRSGLGSCKDTSHIHLDLETNRIQCNGCLTWLPRTSSHREPGGFRYLILCGGIHATVNDDGIPNGGLIGASSRYTIFCYCADCFSEKGLSQQWVRERRAQRLQHACHQFERGDIPFSSFLIIFLTLSTSGEHYWASHFEVAPSTLHRWCQGTQPAEAVQRDILREANREWRALQNPLETEFI